MTPTEEELHAYVDGRLSSARRQQVERWLVEHPERGEQIGAWQRNAQQLRAAFAGQPEPSANADLDPAAIRARLASRRRASLARAATLLLSLGIGLAGGWSARDHQLRAAEPPMEDALQAHRLFVTADAGAAQTVALDNQQLPAWLQQALGGSSALPPMEQAGFHVSAARLLSTAQGPAALVVYHDARGDEASLYIRPPGPHYLKRGERKEGELYANYWSDGRFNYAVVRRGLQPELQAVLGKT